MTLSDFFHQYKKAAIAFSGGVDSAYLLYNAVKSSAIVQPYYVRSAFQPQFELEDAKRIAKQLHIRLKILEMDILSDKRIIENTDKRCYYCKKAIFSMIEKEARKDSFSLLLDGTNASDQEDDRPGMLALHELSVRSPLRECGLTKEDIRKYSKEAGLFTFKKPAYACLATRISTGEKITKESLLKTEKAENFLFSLGFTNFRIRMLGNAAKLELSLDDLQKAIKYREMIITELKKSYSSVLLDLEVRNKV